MFTTELATLRKGLAALDPRDRDFAQSLIQQHDRRGLSDKQWPWVKRLADRLAPNPAHQLGDTAALLALFARTGGKLKYPALTVDLSDQDTLRLHVAGDTARHPGSITVNTLDRQRLGSLHRDGTWSPLDTRSADLYASVADLLTRLLADPAGFLANHGRLSGACCYCGITLTDQRSVQAGYGPTCAKNWGLAWGKRVAA